MYDIHSIIRYDSNCYYFKSIYYNFTEKNIHFPLIININYIFKRNYRECYPKFKNISIIPWAKIQIDFPVMGTVIVS